mgnify:CR=1 FL=1
MKCNPQCNRKIAQEVIHVHHELRHYTIKRNFCMLLQNLSVSVLHNYATAKFHAHAQFNINNKCATQFPLWCLTPHILLPKLLLTQIGINHFCTQWAISSFLQQQNTCIDINQNGGLLPREIAQSCSWPPYPFPVFYNYPILNFYNFIESWETLNFC